MNCEQIRELVEAYALGTLDAETQMTVEQHLAECADCRLLADEYREIVHRLPEAVAAASPLRPPDSLKTRLMQDVEASEAPAQSVWGGRKPVGKPARNWRLSPVQIRFQQVGAAVILVLLIFSLAWIARLSTALAHEQGLRESIESQTELIFEVVDSDQTTRRFLRPTENAPHLPDAAPPYGKVFTRADLPYVVAMTGRLPQPPEGQAYNLWLFGDERIELAGAVTPDDAGFGSLVYQAADNGPVYESAQLILQAENSDSPSGVPVLIWHLNGEN